MKHDASVLTFCSDFPIQENDHVAQMPTGLTTKHDLCAAIQRQITVPTYFKTGNWDHLFEILRFPNLELAPGASRNGRTILLHQDIPLLEADWFEAQTYLEILIDSIQHLRDVNQQEKAVEAENKEELIAVFPPVLANEVWKVLSHPPRWEAAVIIHTANDGEMYLFRSRTANWALVQQWLTHLNEFINEYLELYKKERCCLKIAYLRQHHGYYIIYTSLAEDVQEKPVLSSPIEHRTLTHLLTLEEVIHIVHSVYEHDHLPHNYQWYPLLMQESELDELFVDWYYSNAEEEWIELPDEMVQYTIHRGIDKDAKEVYTLQNWQDILARQDTTLEEYLAVLCVLSKDNLEAMYHRLLTLLETV